MKRSKKGFAYRFSYIRDSIIEFIAISIKALLLFNFIMLILYILAMIGSFFYGLFTTITVFDAVTDFFKNVAIVIDCIIIVLSFLFARRRVFYGDLYVYFPYMILRSLKLKLVGESIPFQYVRSVDGTNEQIQMESAQRIKAMQERALYNPAPYVPPVKKESSYKRIQRKRKEWRDNPHRPYWDGDITHKRHWQAQMEKQARRNNGLQDEDPNIPKYY